MSTISPDAAGIYYDPQTWKVTAAAATTIQGGAELRVMVVGNPGDDLSAEFDLTGLVAPYPHVAISIDNEPAVRSELSASIPIPKPASNQWTKHVVTITVVAMPADVNRWNRQGAVAFTGIRSAATPITSGTIRSSALVGMFLGDSLGEGFWALGTAAVHNQLPSRTDNRYGWAYPLARLLGCRPIQVTFAGVGLTKNGNGSVPRFEENWDQLWSGEPRTFSQLPDFVVSMPGTNDGAATDAAAKAAAISWINTMLARLNNDCPIIIVRPWYGTKAASLQAAIEECNEPARVHWVDTTGWVVAGDSSDNLHPYGYQNVAALAPQLANAIRPIIEGAAPAPGDSVAWMRTENGKVPIAGFIHR